MKTAAENLLGELELDLERSLRPVKPNPEFVNRLHTHLATPVVTVMEARRSSLVPLGMFLVGAGLAVGVLLVWLKRKG